MIRFRKQVLIVLAVVLTACASRPTVTGHLTSDKVQDLMAQSAVQQFDVSRLGGAVIVLDNGEIFTADFPPMEEIQRYLEHRRSIGKPASFEIE